MKPLAILPFALGVALAAPAFAQDEQQKPAAQAEKCRAEPDNQQNAQNGARQNPPATGETQNPPAGDESLTATLDDCDGVLKPPPTGDAEMTAPAPDEGKTPIIKPGEVPQQPPKQD
jgi:hypothetical protein